MAGLNASIIQSIKSVEWGILCSALVQHLPLFPNSNRFLHGQVMEIGKIASVVRQKGSSVPWFKFYDFEKYPMDPPQRGTSAYMYVECATILSTDSKKTGIKWTRRNSVSKQNANKRDQKRFLKWSMVLLGALMIS